jgi:hypothetical protein
MNFSMRLLATALCMAVSAIAAMFWWRSAYVGPVQRGADLATAQGCLGCHGWRRPGGRYATDYVFDGPDAVFHKVRDLLDT